MKHGIIVQHLTEIYKILLEQATDLRELNDEEKSLFIADFYKKKKVAKRLLKTDKGLLKLMGLEKHDFQYFSDDLVTFQEKFSGFSDEVRKFGNTIKGYSNTFPSISAQCKRLFVESKDINELEELKLQKQLTLIADLVIDILKLSKEFLFWAREMDAQHSPQPDQQNKNSSEFSRIHQLHILVAAYFKRADDDYNSIRRDPPASFEKISEKRKF